MIPYFETHICGICNLHCKGCSHFSPLCTEKDKDLTEFEREFARLSEIEEIGIIRLMGGEPLLNENFIEYCRIARKYFPKSKIVLVTNGILAERLSRHIDELNSLNINVTMSEYHLDRQRRDIVEKINLHEFHEKGNLYNISLDLSGSQDSKTAFERCDLTEHRWHYFQDGRFYPCCIAGTIKDFWKYFGLDFGFTYEELGIDIFTHSAEEIEKFICSPCKLCAFCRTDIRTGTYSSFKKSKREITEWTAQ